MTNQIAGLSGEYLSPKTLRFSRTQEEAGISYLPWESRLKPLRPLSHDIALGLGVVSTIAVACLLV
jgi:hypothetical protein